MLILMFSEPLLKEYSQGLGRRRFGKEDDDGERTDHIRTIVEVGG